MTSDRTSDKRRTVGFAALTICAGLTWQSSASQVIDVGRFRNICPSPNAGANCGTVTYTGNFAAFFFTSHEDTPQGQGYTVVNIDVDGLLSSVGLGAFTAVIVEDPGGNSYQGTSSWGADIDLLELVGLDTSVAYVYEGAIPHHLNETPGQLAENVVALDAVSGAMHTTGVFVSLGSNDDPPVLGKLTANLCEAQVIGPANDITLRVSEAGSIEFYQVFIVAQTSPCASDVDGDGVVNVLDLIDLLLCFGQPAVPPCDTVDINGDGVINVLDLIELLGEFGTPCSCGLPAGATLEEELNRAGLTMDNWKDLEDVMENGDPEEKANWKCWMTHYLEGCSTSTGQLCAGPNCPGDDPFEKH